MSEESDSATEARRRNNNSSSRARSVSNSAIEQSSPACENGIGNSQPMTLRSRWQAASSRARESLLRASQEIRTRIRGKQQEVSSVVPDGSAPKSRGSGSGAERDMPENVNTVIS